MFNKIIAYILSPFLKWLAEENIFFTTVKEGTAKAIMRGDSFDHFIMSFAGYHLNAPGKPGHRTEIDIDEKKEKFADWEIVYHGHGNTKGFQNELDSFYDVRLQILKDLGLYWVGWPWALNVYVYQFEWNETYTEHKTGEEKILPRAEPTDFVYVADFVYTIKTVGAETRDRLPTDELTQVTIAVRNPYRALFSGEDWMRRITAAINRHVRTFVGSRDYQDLISPAKKESEENGDDGMSDAEIQTYWKEFSTPIIALNGKLPDDTRGSKPAGLKGRYGIEIRTADLQTMDLSGDGKLKHQEAATKKYTAIQDAEAERLKGQAKADVVEMMGDKEAIALRKRLEVIKEHGDAGMLLAQLDAIQESSKGAGSTTVWANSPFIPLAGLLKPNKGDTK